jgi:H+/gluconate symporter-like permease
VEKGFILLVIFFVFAFLMFKQKISTFLALMGMALCIAVAGGIPFDGKDGILNAVLDRGTYNLASSIMALLFGAWLGEIMNETGITKDIIRRASELGGDRPVLMAILMGTVVAMLFTALTGLGAAIMVGTLVLPILSAVGVRPIVAGCIFLFARTIGMIFNLVTWQLYLSVTKLPLEVIRNFAAVVATVGAIGMLAFILLELRQTRVAWSMANVEMKVDLDNKQVPVYALLTPLVPFPLVIIFQWPIIPALFAGCLYGAVASSPRDCLRVLTKTVHEGVKSAAPALVLMVAIGVVLVAVGNKTVSSSIATLLTPIMPASAVTYALFFIALAPLALYRGPLNMWGLGSGIIGVMIATKALPPAAIAAAFLAAQFIQLSADPTNTHNVWTADFLGIEVNDITKKYLLHVWGVCAVSIIGATFLFF